MTDCWVGRCEALSDAMLSSSRKPSIVVLPIETPPFAVTDAAVTIPDAVT